ncbi:hypothetical protein RIdsm_04490 [Roseovarius indicus]|uniref:Uncharacterized protein n=1 Tax=Roseovarius indicus TaxID=540747 RepID=A0A5P3AJX7_9RHOB|nr:hypothetical protein RIdsm_04490 [Roseovarius indicus]SFE69504.1 hypothetical protein SAMN04488031_11695 [Roseovarius indicus]
MWAGKASAALRSSVSIVTTLFPSNCRNALAYDMSVVIKDYQAGRFTLMFVTYEKRGPPVVIQDAGTLDQARATRLRAESKVSFKVGTACYL